MIYRTHRQAIDTDLRWSSRRALWSARAKSRAECSSTSGKDRHGHLDGCAREGAGRGGAVPGAASVLSGQRAALTDEVATLKAEEKRIEDGGSRTAWRRWASACPREDNARGRGGGATLGGRLRRGAPRAGGRARPRRGIAMTSSHHWDLLVDAVRGRHIPDAPEVGIRPMSHPAATFPLCCEDRLLNGDDVPG
jgi:hypothetical protein